MAEVLLVEFAVGPITVNYEVTHGSLTYLLFHGNQAKVERNGAGPRPYSYPELICGWDAPPSSPARAEIKVVYLSCTVLLIYL